MDRILDSGSNDKGSIPFGSTKKGYDFQKFVTLFFRVRHRAKNVAISQYEKLFWQTKTSCEKISSILSFRG